MPERDQSITQPDFVRASDEDRERVITQLRDEAAAGRLDTDELAERTETALRARTQGELTQLTRDLPVSSGARRTSAPAPHRRHSSNLRRLLPLAALLIAIWALTGAGYFWPVWPILGVGISMLAPGGCGHRRATHGARGTRAGGAYREAPAPRGAA